ncbi:hypothetical protein ANCCAN_13564, partial [Ancylostoma caninum]
AIFQSSIAKRLLLNKTSSSVTNTVPARSNFPVRFCDPLLEIGEPTHAEDLLGCSASTSTAEGCKSLSSLYGSYLMPSGPRRRRKSKTKPTSPAEPISEAEHDCNDLCNRVKALTPQMLTAPIEKPYEPLPSSRRGAVARPSMGQEARDLIRHVRAFFEEVKRQLGEKACHGTLLNSAVQMAALACGVSQCTVTRLGTSEEKAWDRVKKKPSTTKNALGKRNAMRIVSLKQYGEEWGDVVRHFVHSQLEQEVNLTVADLHVRLCCAYSHFPMAPQTLCPFVMYEFFRVFDVNMVANLG